LQITTPDFLSKTGGTGSHGKSTNELGVPAVRRGQSRISREVSRLR